MLHSINYCMCVFLKFICIYFFLYYRGPCVRKLFTGLIMYLPSQNKEHCIVLYCKVFNQPVILSVLLSVIPSASQLNNHPVTQLLSNSVS